MDFEKLYQSTSDRQKLKYLDEIIRHNAQLQQEFMHFVDKADSPSVHDEMSFEDFANQIEEVQADYINDFGYVDFENPDWDNYLPSSSGYMPEWEQNREAIEQEFDSLFDSFYDDVLDTILSHNAEELTTKLAGLYKAACNIKIHDEYDLFPELNEFLLERHQSVLIRIIAKLSLSSMPEPRILSAIALFLQYCSKEQDRGTKLLRVFEDYLMALAEKSEKPGQILSSIHESGADLKVLPKLIMLLNQNCGNAEEWLRTAKQHYRENNEVAKRLLQHYHENDTAAYLQLAGELFLKDSHYWAPQLKEHITPENDKRLFVDVYYQLVLEVNSMADYQKLRPHLSSQRFESLMSDLVQKCWDAQFAAKLLAAENRHEVIKNKIEKDSFRWVNPDIVALIVEAYPAFCFNLIKSEVQSTMQHQRNRHGYKRLMPWLKVANTIPGFQTQSRQLISDLYNHKPNLPALKDEMRMAGVV